MEFRDVVHRRRMVRNFLPDPLPPEAVERILANAQRSPSAGFSQGTEFLVLQDHADRGRFWSVLDDLEDDRAVSAGLRPAPLLVAVLSNREAYLDRYAEPDKGWADRDEARWPVPYWHVDAGMAALLMLLTAVDEGLGALLFGVPPEAFAAFRRAFGVPERFVPVGAVAVGRRTGDPGEGSGTRRPRRPAAQVLHRGRW
jgi:nitroreductase